ncbi:GGDEF domain-containing protein [Arcobacter sp. FWKO B]|uniref:GGDEF domain-containing protein n=1 Tax=Arcobacter sp. FWKO B TaxID=2593672 RepID=UPI0018A61A5B|nr:GGDEF domain-containing protein [Arcobacter sp. FWKO B]QOG11565.1 GGDEF domain-containing protein [Arcobacter sp. FWKO B]
MKQLVLKAIDKKETKQSIKEEVSNVFELIEWLSNDFTDNEKFFSKLSLWLAKEFKIRHIKVIIKNTKNNHEHVIFHKGKEFDINDELCFTNHIEVSNEEEIFISLYSDNYEHQSYLYEHIADISSVISALKPYIINTILFQELKENSFRDSVTGLYNRVFLVEHLHQLLPLALREGKQIAFLMVGIDHFKAVIDEFDYKIGDKVLISLANVLKDNIRESDVVVRLNGDDFLVVLANVKDEDSTIAVALKLVQKFSEVEVDVGVYSGQKLKKTICIGISMYPQDSTSIDQILKNADISLYEARNLGRSKVLRFQKEQEGMVHLF